MTDHTQKHIDSPEVAAWWAERRRYLEQIRKTPELRRQFRKEVALYLLRRALWCYGFFPVVIAFWLPFVLSSFNPVDRKSTRLNSSHVRISYAVFCLKKKKKKQTCKTNY